MVIAVVLTILAQTLTQDYQSEIEQKLHLKLAEHIIHDNQLFNGNDIHYPAVKHAFSSMMILGPSFEFYVISPTGKILTYSADPERIKRSNVDIAPINDFIKERKPFPILGDDPRSSDKQKIFSVAPIYAGQELKGYLYIIIGGEIYDDIASLLQNSHIVTLGGWSVLLILFMTLIVTLLLFAMLTRPLRRLTSDIEAYRESGFENTSMPLSQWKADSNDEIERLGNSFNELIDVLNNQYQKVKNTDELRRELISYASHDLRTPLTSLQGYLETWLLKHGNTDNGRALIEVAMKNATNISELIEQLFELAYLDSGDAKLHKEPISMSELAQDVISKRLLEANEKNIQLDVHPKESIILLMGDYQKLNRVLSNIIDNGMRHSMSGDKIEIRLRDVGEQRWAIEIQDSGVGIPSDEINDIFLNHFRASNSIKGKGENSGLGLSICKRIIELHGSELHVTSTLGKGTCFYFFLDEANAVITR
jgi:signal transduction histidine kinase